MRFKSDLSILEIVGYGLGHIFNDICASMWFTYLLLFFQKVLYFKTTDSGALLFAGQIADGVSTTLVGLLADKLANFILCRKYGGRKSWHLLGSVCVLCSFPFIFLSCIGCSTSSREVQMVYYTSFIVVFQFGWACVQISHLALVTQLSERPETRTLLTSIRYLGTVVANLLVYAVTWVMFGTAGDQPEISSADGDKFRNIMIIGVGVGLVTTLLFHILVRERTCRSSDEKKVDLPLSSYFGWLKNPQFYLVGIVYTASRLFVNLSQSYIPLYLQDSIMVESEYVAIIPLIMFLSGFVTSFFINPLHRLLSEGLTWVLGGIIGMGAAIWLYFDIGSFYLQYGIFIVAALYGGANSVLLITSLSFTANLVGNKISSASFVYGLMSLFDKVANGAAILIIQKEIKCLKLQKSVAVTPGTALADFVSTFLSSTSAAVSWTEQASTTAAVNSTLLSTTTDASPCMGCTKFPDLEHPCFKFFRSVIFSVTGGAAVVGTIFSIILFFTYRRPRKEIPRRKISTMSQKSY